MGRTLRSGRQGIPVDPSRFINNGPVPSRELQEKFANMHLTPSPQRETNGVAAPLALPWELIQYIKKAVEIMKHLEKNPDDKFALIRLKCTESGINKIVKYRKQPRIFQVTGNTTEPLPLPFYPREDSS